MGECQSKPPVVEKIDNYSRDIVEIEAKERAASESAKAPPPPQSKPEMNGKKTDGDPPAKAEEAPSETSAKETQPPAKEGEAPAKEAEAPEKEAEAPEKEAETPVTESEESKAASKEVSVEAKVREAPESAEKEAEEEPKQSEEATTAEEKATTSPLLKEEETEEPKQPSPPIESSESKTEEKEDESETQSPFESELKAAAARVAEPSLTDADGATAEEQTTQGPQRVAQICLVGAGRWSQGWHLPQMNANPKCNIAALACGRSVPKLAEKYGCPGFATVDEFLASDVAKTIDGVIVASAHAAHYEAGLKLIEAGFNIFMEKPMTTDLPEAMELTKAANAAGKIFMVNNTANWRSSTKLAQNLVAKGGIGEVRHANLFFGTPLGFLLEDPKQVGWVKPTGTMIGNGFGWGQFAHTFGWFYLVSGLTAKSVFAFTAKSEKSGADLYDAVTILCTNGATVTVSGSGTIPGNSKIVKNRLIGTEGMISYIGSYPIDEGPGCAHSGEGGEDDGSAKNANPGQLELKRYDGRNLVVPGFEYENVEQGGIGPESLQAFIDGCLGEEYYVGTTADIGLACVATIDAMYRSALSGKAEEVYP